MHPGPPLTILAPAVDPGRAFADLARDVRAGVEAQLVALLDARVEQAYAHAPDVGFIAEAVRALTLRSAKRVRAVLVAAGYEACGGEGGAQAVTMAGVAMELLQTYLLVHDDWMDDDDMRRGGPSVHAMLRARFGSAKDGDAAAILAGDYTAGLAQEALLEVPVVAARLVEAARVFARMQVDVVTGQMIDVRGAAGDRVEAMHDLKTGSYTARGPLLLGAALAGARPEARDALLRFAAPLGVAFQLRDDLLGTFGDPRATGKPKGSDLRQGKRTALVAELAHDAVAKPHLARALGVADASDADVEALAAHMIASGARARVEARLQELLADARRALRDAPITARGKAVLEGAVLALGERER